MDTSLGDILVVARTVIDAMDAASVDYYIGGSIASGIYGEPRMTRDLDFITRMEVHQVPLFVESLGDQFYADADMIREAIEFHSSGNVIDLRVAVKADIMVPAPNRFVDSEFSRKTWAKLTNHPDSPEGYLCSAEDIVLQKLRWYRMGGEISDRQWRDVQGVLTVQAGKLDEQYLHAWAAELGISDLLARVREDAQRPWDPSG